MSGVDPAGVTEARGLTGGDEPIGGIFVGGSSTGIFRDGALRQLVEERPIIVAVDDEGGRVQRIDAIAGDLPSPRVQSGWSESRIRSEATARGRRLLDLGVTVDFAPVVDVTTQLDGEIIGDRSYGPTAATVVRGAGAFADGLRSAGVVPTFKHFPGHGRGSGDSHHDPVSTPGLVELERSDLVPYRDLLDDGPAWVMMGHLDTPGLTEPGMPASLSPSAYRYLRSQLGFTGIVVTDELGGMRAIASRFSPGQAAVRAIAAGADVALFADADVVPGVIEALTRAVADGRIPSSRVDDAVVRVRDAMGC